ncbi:hypothetical protein [Legionella maioricensis]|uniref:Uncharacterized protein n=1 Tax=Legionella maioricensis TaxID=2896528 RepID=A0A9X2IA29_9GAMM|nr:hypothetical protein [Legionella maioricensis]MCL9683704.1 hypothetical protein [Legionella maioricensis]MCL9687478.1 hypothetical protein [Legionella maioricensis]
MYHFFLADDLPSALEVKSKTYQVLTSRGVMIKASDEHQYVRTDGLRTCVAFGIINPFDSSAMLIHFFNLKQVQNDLKLLAAQFIEQSSLDETGVIIVIAGGREFFPGSVDMCDYLIKFAKEIAKKIPVTFRLTAPVVASDEETLSVQINLLTGDSDIAINPSNIEADDYSIESIDSIIFTDMINEVEENKAVASCQLI